jgi:hypothetical protein
MGKGVKRRFNMLWCFVCQDLRSTWPNVGCLLLPPDGNIIARPGNRNQINLINDEDNNKCWAGLVRPILAQGSYLPAVRQFIYYVKLPR